MGIYIHLGIIFGESHAVNVVNFKCHSGSVIFIGGVQIIWNSRFHNIIELEGFGSEFVVVKDFMEANKSLCYKFRIMGVEIYGGIGVFSVNKSVVLDDSIYKLSF